MTSPRAIWEDRPQRPLDFAETSYLLVVVQSIVWLLWHLSLIEYIKVLFMWLVASDRRRHARSLAIDVYTVFKWLVLGTLIYWECNSAWATYGVTYLIASNFLSYFYYHVWLPGPEEDIHIHQLRRTVAFVLAFFFGIAAYGYIFLAGFSDQIDWPMQTPTYSDAFLLSLSNALTGNFASYVPLTLEASWVMAGETLTIFGFLVIVVVNSVPMRR